jgi:hypothetical protein
LRFWASAKLADKIKQKTHSPNVRHDPELIGILLYSSPIETGNVGYDNPMEGINAKTQKKAPEPIRQFNRIRKMRLFPN